MKFLFLLLAVSVSGSAFAQTYYRMDDTNDGALINFTCPISDTRFADDGPNSTHYSNNTDRTISFCAPAGRLLRFDFGCGSNLTIERIDPTDTLFIYDGNSTSAPLLYAVTGNPSNSDRLPYFGESSSFAFTAPSECITFRFVSDASDNNDGWDACISCVSPVACGDNEPASDLFGGAPYICNLDGYCGRTSGDFGADYPHDLNQSGGNCPSTRNFLGTIENNSWLRFIADSTDVVFDFTVPLGGGCSNGIQVAVLAYDGLSLTRMSPCALSDGSNAGNFQLTASGLTPGDTYYIMTDGNAGDVCDYVINANAGVAVLRTGPDQELCTPGAAIELSATGPGAATYTWNSLDNVVTNQVGQTITVNPLLSTTYVVELSGASVCTNQRDTVEVGGCTLLSLDVLKLGASCKGSAVHISWQLSEEARGREYIVQKFDTQFGFLDIGQAEQVKYAGDASYLYEFIDRSQKESTQSYYRLKRGTADEEPEYSDILALSPCQDAQSSLQNVYISGQQLILSYESAQAQDLELRLFDVQGRLVFVRKVSLLPGEQVLEYELDADMREALYFVQILSGQQMETRKLLRSQ